MMKNIWLGIFWIGLMTLCFNGIATAELNDGLVAYYPFNDNANDETGNGHDGFEFNGVTYVYSILGQGAGFDGKNDYIDIPYSPEIEPSIFSLSVWIKTTMTATGTVLSSDPNSHYCSHGYGLYIVDGYVKFGTDPSASCGDGNNIQSNIPLNDGNWHHVAATYNVSKKLYIDGILQNNTSESIYLKTNSSLRLGMRKSSHSSKRTYFRGSIDNLRIYDRVLMDNEVEELSAMNNNIISILYNPNNDHYYLKIDSDDLT